ncbi:MarR family winged helix-turn-helix transcriptional regulator [Arthrobacter roseus]|uniref:MarR family winged helix-turn-helix transcriptional regulator n=1 Tax=Arthrobacter roseus TaxID=136274 RepID=UPI001964096D|nr:MarR family transcriptional regulator [Arthrobacter roseus]MBM7847884.1 DNA-binding MarR family transcriptional regulator [Arthrobacter roseus]
MEHNRPIGFWLKLVDGLVDSRFESMLEEHGVTRRQWQLLNLLAERPTTVAELESELEPFLSLPGGETIPEHLEELTESGWVSQSDGTYSLEELGRNSMAVLSEVVAENRAQVTEGVTHADYETTVAVLERMARNLGWGDK